MSTTQQTLASLDSTIARARAVRSGDALQALADVRVTMALVAARSKGK